MLHFRIYVYFGNPGDHYRPFNDENEELKRRAVCYESIKRSTSSWGL